MKYFSFFILFSLNISLSYSFDFTSWTKSFFGGEYCDDQWINLDINGLKSDLRENVFGQHLMQNIVIRMLQSHMKQPKKALVLSFHGPTGTGKNLVSSIISRNLFKKNTSSQFYHLYLGSIHFPHSGLKDEYKEQLRNDVERATKKCNRNLFIFDELDKSTPGVLDALSPYIDFHDSLKGVDYRNNIFIFISNAGSTNITKAALKFLETGKEREDMSLKDIESLVSTTAFHEVGGLFNSELIKRNRIDIFVPFLPLEKKHIKQCILAELKELKCMLMESLVNEIMGELTYIPKDNPVYSHSGCRHVHKRISLIADHCF